jgi:pyridoxal 5'-phosphate synthase pdxT subunit
MKIGVLALQGDFIEHQHILEKIGCEVVQVRLPGHLDGLQGLIIPGGESTTIGKLATAYQLMAPLRAFGKKHALWGTCAGAIFISNDTHRDQPLLKLMDIEVERNAFGRQVDSFEMDLDVPVLQRFSSANLPFHAVFIRAPLIASAGDNVKTLSSLPNRKIVAAQQGKLLATSFHPELTGDDRFHRYFLELTK